MIQDQPLKCFELNSILLTRNRIYPYYSTALTSFGSFRTILWMNSMFWWFSHVQWVFKHRIWMKSVSLNKWKWNQMIYASNIQLQSICEVNVIQRNLNGFNAIFSVWSLNLNSFHMLFRSCQFALVFIVRRLVRIMNILWHVWFKYHDINSHLYWLALRRHFNVQMNR